MSIARLAPAAYLCAATLTMCVASAAAGIPGDADSDGIIDVNDWIVLSSCMTGPAGGPLPLVCRSFDQDDDQDIDLHDLAPFARSFTAQNCAATASASSVENDDALLVADRAVDGNFLTRWSSAFSDGEWIEIDLGRQRTFDGLRIYWEYAHASTYDVSVSPDGVNWTSVYYTDSSDGGLDKITFPEQTARYVLINCIARATTYGNSIYEVVLQSADNCYGYDAAVAEQIELFIENMTLDEKTTLLYGQTYLDLHAIPRLGIPSLKLADGPLGIRWDQATAFPASIALGATWDTELVERVGRAIGREFRNKGRQVWLGPCVNIIRVPHGGRNFETYGEDPHLNARMARAIIRGAQSQNVVATVKHYACNNQEYDRFNINIQVDERPFREIYLPAYKAAVQEAGVWSVMSAYNRLNGPYCTANAYLQQTILKDKWGFNGFVVSDWGAVHDTIGPANAGLDLEMDGGSPVGIFWGSGQLLNAVVSGSVAGARINDKVRRILRAMYFTGIMDAEWPAPDVELVEHRSIVREAGRSGIVLLKNDNDVLPLNPNGTQTLAVIGPNAAVARTGGGGSSSVWPYRAISPLEGIQAAVGPHVTVHHRAGVQLPNEPPPAVSSEWLSPPSGTGSGLLGEYFANQNLQGSPVVTRVDSQVDFDWGQGTPDPLVPSDHFSVRWTGTLTVPQTATYDLGTYTDDGVRVYLDDNLVIDDWNDHAAELHQVQVYLETGQSYDLRVEYYENGGDAIAQLSVFEPGSELADAVSVAGAADAALLFVGLSSAVESEGYDRPSLSLSSAEVSLIQSVAAANANTAVVVVGGSQVDMVPWVANVPSVLQSWYLGQEQGHALADILFGFINPSGKLPMTFIEKWSDHPSYNNYPGGVYTEGLYVGYRHFDTFDAQPLFPFGHGLSYTNFHYRDLIVDDSLASVDGTLTVYVTIENIGPRAGAEVVQLYVRDVVSSLPRADRELKGFRKVGLAAGESRQIFFELAATDFAYYDDTGPGWIVEPGQFELLLGASSRDIRESISVTYPPLPQ